MTWDGESLWINDFALMRVFQVAPHSGEILHSFAIPDVLGGAKGLTWTGQHLALLGWRSHAIWLLDQLGRVVGRLHCPLLKGGLAWDGESFWGPYREWIVQIAPSGEVLGAINAASDGTWDLEWHAGLLWATQRTNENWHDPKLFALEVLDRNLLDLESLRNRQQILGSLFQR
jgi:hypothetical protein